MLLLPRALRAGLFFLLASLAPSVWAEAFHFVALGDLPYGPAEKADPPYRALIGLINKERPAFSIHVGDIKSGASECSDAELARQRANFDRFEGAVVYTPGDNEWTDCHRRSNGGFDPLERLAALRQRFFTPGRSLGRAPLQLDNQSTAQPAHGRFVENQRWLHQGVLFATLHVVGSNNNFDPDRPAAQAEFLAREQANIAWLQSTFAQARRQHAQAVVLAMQANPLGLFNFTGTVTRQGFQATIGQTLLPLARESGVPVLLIHGDTHTYRLDQPFRLAGQPLHNLTRLEVPGDGDVRAVRVSVDLTQAQPFAVRPLGGD